MPQEDLERELAAATGEDVRTIRRRGFQLVTQRVINNATSVLEDQIIVEWRGTEQFTKVNWRPFLPMPGVLPKTTFAFMSIDTLLALRY